MFFFVISRFQKQCCDLLKTLLFGHGGKEGVLVACFGFARKCGHQVFLALGTSILVDNKTPLPEHIKVMENGKERTLRTIGDKWSYLQRSKFGANAQPFYVLIDNEGKPLNKSYSYDEDIDKYVDFLQTGLQNYKK
jgi:hypothetical protein